MTQLRFRPGVLALAVSTVVGVLTLSPTGLSWLLLSWDAGDYESLSFLFDPSILWQFVAIWALIGLTVQICYGMIVRAPYRRPLATVLVDQNGALIFEFALIFPFILALIFILFQWIELLMADSLVHYAAFSACRTAASYGSAPENRFDLSGEKWKKMTQAAEVALAGAKAMEGAQKHQPAKIEFFSKDANAGGSENIAIKQPTQGGGSYRFVHLRCKWGFFPRWPLAQMFFLAMIERGRIQCECDYAMTVDGYYRSHSLNTEGLYANPGATHPNKPDNKNREALIQGALYGQVLKGSHGNTFAVSGNRDKLRNQCGN